MLRRLIAALALLTVFATAAAAAPQEEVTFGGTGSDDTSVAEAITIGPGGEIYVAGYYRGEFGSLSSSDWAAYVQRLDEDLDVVWERSIAEGAAFSRPPLGVWVDGDDQLWVKVNHRVGAFDPHGNELLAPDPVPIGNMIETLDANRHGAGLVGSNENTDEVLLIQTDFTTTWTFDVADGAPGTLDGDVVVRSTPSGFVAVVSLVGDGTPNDQSTLLIGLDPDGSEVWRTWIEERRIDATTNTFSNRPSFVEMNGDVLHLMTSVDDDPDPDVWTNTDRAFVRIDTTDGDVVDTRSLDASQYCIGTVTDTLFPEPVAGGTGSCEPGGRQPADLLPRFFRELPSTIHPDGDELVTTRPEIFSGDRELLLRHDLNGDPTLEVLQVVPMADDAHVGDLVYAADGNLYVVGFTNTDGFGLAATSSANPRAFVAVNPWTHGFSDITRSWQDGPVFWMKQNGITNGVSRTEFAPDRNITRGELAALMYRANGNPDPGADHPFTDIARSWQDAPVAWMFNNGITTGVSDTEFAPDRPVTRGELAAFWWRMAGFPDVATAHGFVDVVAAWQQAAVRWLKSTGITTGVSDTEFAPGRNVTRGEVAAFLFRYDQIVGLPLG